MNANETAGCHGDGAGESDESDGSELAETAESRAALAEHELLVERDRVIGMGAELAHLRWQLDQERERAWRAEQALVEARGSLRFRVGNALVAPLGRLWRRR